MIPHRTVLSVDLGKTRCRVASFDVDAAGQSTRTTTREGLGAPGLAAPGGVDAALATIRSLVPPAPMADALVVGAAGALAAPDAAAVLATELTAATGIATSVTSDAVTAHVGALAGAPGVLLIAGTGAVGIGVTADGMRVVDGWGPQVGDFGSGAWIGRAGLGAVLRARSGSGPATALVEAAAEVGMPGEDIVRVISEAADQARRVASFAPSVIAAAAADDAVASDIVDRAVAELVRTARAAADGASDVSLHGGLTASTFFRDLLAAALAAADLRAVELRGDALDGACLLAVRTDLPHERVLHRVS